MQGYKVFFAGVSGALLITALTAVARVAGMPVNMEMMLGSMITQATGTGTWFLGFVIHLMIGGLFGLVYGYGFERWTHRAGWQVGLGFGALHTVLSGSMLALMPMLHPLIPETLPAPGVFMGNLGAMGVIAFTVLHLAYGTLVGSVYAPVHVPRTATSH